MGDWWMSDHQPEMTKRKHDFKMLCGFIGNQPSKVSLWLFGLWSDASSVVQLSLRCTDNLTGLHLQHELTRHLFQKTQVHLGTACNSPQWNCSKSKMIKTFSLTLTECFQDITTSAFPRVWIKLSPQQQERGDAESRKTSLKRTCSRAQVMSDWPVSSPALKCSMQPRQHWNNKFLIDINYPCLKSWLQHNRSYKGRFKDYMTQASTSVWAWGDLSPGTRQTCPKSRCVCEACQDFTEWRRSGFPLHFLTACTGLLPQKNIFSYWRNK